MRILFALVLLPLSAMAQAPGHWPPDSLINTKVFPHKTPVAEVIGQMRNFTSDLGVRCQFCHVGQEGQPIAQFDFASDQKRTKLVARQMMLMVQEINRRVDTLPGRGPNGLTVTCQTCHHGVSRPAPLFTVIGDIATMSGADSAVRAYKALRNQYYGKAAYDFSQPTLDITAFRLGRSGKYDEAMALFRLNEELYPGVSNHSVLLGNVLLMRGDTSAAADSYREAIRRDTSNAEARGRLQAIKRAP